MATDAALSVFHAPAAVTETAPRELVNAAPPMLMTPAEVARELRISDRSFRRHVQAGKIGPAPHCLGHAVRYLRDEVTRWIQAGMPDRDAWREMAREIAPTLRRVSAAQNNGRRDGRRP